MKSGIHRPLSSATGMKLLPQSLWHERAYSGDRRRLLLHAMLFSIVMLTSDVIRDVDTDLTENESPRQNTE